MIFREVMDLNEEIEGRKARYSEAAARRRETDEAFDAWIAMVFSVRHGSDEGILAFPRESVARLGRALSALKGA